MKQLAKVRVVFALCLGFGVGIACSDFSGAEEEFCRSHPNFCVNGKLPADGNFDGQDGGFCKGQNEPCSDTVLNDCCVGFSCRMPPAPNAGPTTCQPNAPFDGGCVPTGAGCTIGNATPCCSDGGSVGFCDQNTFQCKLQVGQAFCGGQDAGCTTTGDCCANLACEYSTAGKFCKPANRNSLPDNYECASHDQCASGHCASGPNTGTNTVCQPVGACNGVFTTGCTAAAQCCEDNNLGPGGPGDMFCDLTPSPSACCIPSGSNCRESDNCCSKSCDAGQCSY
jgi:hypothetical protein